MKVTLMANHHVTHVLAQFQIKIRMSHFVIWMDKRIGPERHQLRTGVAGQLTQRMIGVEDAALRVSIENSAGKVREYRLEGSVVGCAVHGKERVRVAVGRDNISVLLSE